MPFISNGLFNCLVHSVFVYSLESTPLLAVISIWGNCVQRGTSLHKHLFRDIRPLEKSCHVSSVISIVHLLKANMTLFWRVRLSLAEQSSSSILLDEANCDKSCHPTRELLTLLGSPFYVGI